VRMDREVLYTQEFEQYAAANLVLMTADFPRLTQLPDDVVQQNANLKNQYGVQGFPSFILVDKDGKVLGRHVGYLKGGPAAFIALLDSIKGNAGQ
jgi:thioredoxin-related protein